MAESLYLVAGFVLLLALVPYGVKWLQSRGHVASTSPVASNRVLSAVAVGPQQRVVTVEAGVGDSRVLLVLGVTPHQVTCLHTFRRVDDSVAQRPDAAMPAVMDRGAA